MCGEEKLLFIDRVINAIYGTVAKSIQLTTSSGENRP